MQMKHTRQFIRNFPKQLIALQNAEQSTLNNIFGAKHKITNIIRIK